MPGSLVTAHVSPPADPGLGAAPSADAMLANYHLDLAFIDVDGLSAVEGCTTFDEMEAATNRACPLRLPDRAGRAARKTLMNRVFGMAAGGDHQRMHDHPDERADAERVHRAAGTDVRREADGRTAGGPAGVAAGVAVNAGQVMGLQRSVGNQATAGLLVGAPRSARIGPSEPFVSMSTVQRDDDPTAPTTAAPTTDAPTADAPAKSGLLDGSGLVLADPSQFLANKPSLAPTGGLPMLPPAAVAGLINWGDLGAAYRDRKLTLEDRDREVITGHYQRWYPVAQALYRLPLAAKIFDSPAAIMSTLTAKMIDTSLAGDNPNVVEQFNAQAERLGVDTHVVSVPIAHF